MAVLTSSFKQSLKSAPYVFKNTHLYFGFYYITFVIFVFSIPPYIFASEQDFSSVLLTGSRTIFNIITNLSLIFIIPYYTYKYSKSLDIKPFWNFVRKTFWPVIWNYYIKATLIILFFFVLLIIPGIYKGARLSFVSETIFFDDLYKQNQISALKGSDRTSRGYFWPVCLISLLTITSLLTIHPLTLFLLKKYLSFPLFINEILAFLFLFYTVFFSFLFYTQFYFELKQQRGESISF